MMQKDDFWVKVSKYMSYLLRHNPDGLSMDEYGYVDLDKLVRKIRERFQVDENFIRKIVENSERRRFEISGNKIRALYGHSIPISLELEEDISKKVFYHGTTPEAALKILREGLKPMKRRWVHLSPTVKIAREIGYRRTRSPVILEIDAERARRDGFKFYKATDKVYLCQEIPPKYIKRKS
mgnify:CR=1 FL=1